MNRLFIKKSVEQIQRESEARHLKRTLGPVNLIFLGIGCVIGAGIYVMTGNAAANFAGPAVMLSFVLAGIACAFAALCYAELSSTMPVPGSSYSYSYVTIGELLAWIMGWLMLLEYGIAASVVAVGWSGYVASFLHDFGIVIPSVISTSTIQSAANSSGHLIFEATANINLVAAAGILVVTGLLVLGVSESAAVNNVIVFIKVGVLIIFIIAGIGFVNPANWKPFIPENQGGFAFGIPGIFRAASVIFFAYFGFEAVSTAAGESRNPRRDVPIGILGALAVCTVIYILVAAVLTGIVPYRLLGVREPIALAADRMGMPWFSFAIKVGAVAGLSSVMLILTYAQTRVFLAMARDGLLPRVFSTIHRKFRTPWIGTIILGAIIALTASLLPITILGDLCSLGTALAFSIVCFSVLWLRKTRPDLPRRFTAPLGLWTPILGVIFALLMAIPLIMDITMKAMSGDPIPAIILAVYLIIGTSLYAFYGYSHSLLAKGLDFVDDHKSNPAHIAAPTAESQ